MTPWIRESRARRFARSIQSTSTPVNVSEPRRSSSTRVRPTVRLPLMVSMRWLPDGISPSWRASVSETTVEAPPVSSRKRYGPAPFTMTRTSTSLSSSTSRRTVLRRIGCGSCRAAARRAASGVAAHRGIGYSREQQAGDEGAQYHEDQRRADGPVRS